MIPDTILTDYFWQFLWNYNSLTKKYQRRKRILISASSLVVRHGIILGRCGGWEGSRRSSALGSVVNNTEIMPNDRVVIIWWRSKRYGMNGWSKRRHSLLFMNSLPQMEEMRPEQNQNQATINVISLSLFPLPFRQGLSSSIHGHRVLLY